MVSACGDAPVSISGRRQSGYPGLNISWIKLKSYIVQKFGFDDPTS